MGGGPRQVDEVFVTTDASGTFNQVTRHSARLRMLAARVRLMSWFGMTCELPVAGEMTSRDQAPLFRPVSELPESDHELRCQQSVEHINGLRRARSPPPFWLGLQAPDG